MPKNARLDESQVRAIERVIANNLGENFANSVYPETRKFTEISYKLSAQENQFRNARISFGPIDVQNIETAKSNGVFWIKSHYDTAISDKLADIINTNISENNSSTQLANELKTEFSSISKQSDSYFQGLAEHTGLRVREFGRLHNYHRLGATHYQIVAVIDDRTSDICLALDGKIFPLEPALKSIDAMMRVQEETSDPDEAKERLKEIAPFIRDDQIEYNDAGIPYGISGEHVGFPPFHWRCRSRTIML
jgi:SPP1 gp7 family putative phage head morphogenesis protein